MTKKNKIILIIAAIFIILVSTITILLITKPWGGTATKANDVVTQESANKLKTNAIESIKNNELDAAKTKLEEANAQYKELKDNDNAVDTEMQLKIIEYLKNKASNTTEATTPATTENVAQ